MSFKLYSKFWVATKEDLKNLLQHEHVIETYKPTENRLLAHRIFASIYPRYVVLCNNLADIYDQTLQVQKRLVVGKLLEAATKRLQELHKQLCEIEMSEIIYTDRTLIENHLAPHDIKILKPFYFPLQRSIEIQNLIDGIKPKVDESEASKPLTGLEKFRRQLTPEEIEEQRVHQILVDAIDTIKKHEKGRQSRTLYKNIERDSETYRPKPRPVTGQIPYEFYFKPDTVMLVPVKRTVYESNFYQNLISFSHFGFYKKPVIVEEEKPQFGRRIRKKSKLESMTEDISFKIHEEQICQCPSSSEEDDKIPSEPTENEIMNIAATKIQFAWRRFQLKRKIREKYLKKLQFFGMIDERKYDFTIEKNLQELRERRRAKKFAFDEAFVKAIEDEKARILKVRTPWIMEDISDHIREWFREFYYKVQDFDRYPEEFEGGTILVVKGETMDPEEFKVRQAEMEAEKNKTPDQKAKVGKTFLL